MIYDDDWVGVKIYVDDREWNCQGHSTLTLPVYYSAPSQGQLVQLAVLTR